MSAVKNPATRTKANPRWRCRLRRITVPVNVQRLVTITLLALGSSACSHVAAYERGRLAHPTMNPEDGTSAGLDHVRAVQEGATGGQIGVASGCGCN